jgi:hypothetical protein
VRMRFKKAGPEFSLAALELNALRPKTRAAPDGQPAQPAAPTVELRLNGTQLLLALGAVLSLTAVVLWAVLHYWIFAH